MAAGLEQAAILYADATHACAADHWRCTLLGFWGARSL